MADIKVYAFIGNKRNSWDNNEYVNGKQFADAIAAVADGEDVTVRVASGGGSVVEGNLIINAMKASGKNVHAIIDGYAASMGYFMCLGASKITAAKNSLIMLHSVQGGASGSPEELRAEADVLDKFNASVAQLLADRTGLTVEEVTAQYLGKEVWFTAQEALDAKLIDGIEAYDAENIPAVTAGMSNAEQMERFAAMNAQHSERSFIAQLVDKVKAALKSDKPEPQAALVNSLDWAAKDYYDSLIWGEQQSINAAKCCIANSSNATAIAEAKVTLTNCLAELNALIQKVYGDGADTAVVVAQITEQRTAKADEQITAKVADAITGKLAEKDAAIQALNARVQELEKKPVTAPSAVKKPAGETVEGDDTGHLSAEEQRYVAVKTFDFKTAKLDD